MSTFDLQSFIADPTLEIFDRCRKDDLLQIAEYYRIPVVRQSLKHIIKNEIWKHLVELKVFLFPDADSERAGMSAVEKRLTSVGNVAEAEDENAEVEVEAEPKAGLPPFYPLSPLSVGSGGDARLRVRLAKIQMEAQERAETRQAEIKLRLEIRKLEIEAETQVKLRQLELDSATVVSGRTVQPNPVVSVNSENSVSDVSTTTFDVSKQIALVPHFRESEVDAYFAAFERVAAALRWPKEVWCLLLQCRLVGKAQEVCSALTLEESMQYDTVKNAVLRAYELVPEAYRQRFRNHKKSAQTFVEFAREKGILFDKWLSSNNVQDLSSLRELMLLEDFKNCLSERVVTYLNEQKVTMLSQAAILADEYVLTHKSVFALPRPEKMVSSFSTQNSSTRAKISSPQNKETRECFYCHKMGHLISDCLMLRRKTQAQQGQLKPVTFVKTVPKAVLEKDAIDSGFKPFLLKGLISVNGKPGEQKEVQILRDTGSIQSFVVSDALPLSEQTFCGSSVLVQGIEMGVVKVPLHRIHLQCDLVSGFVKVGIRSSFPVKGVAFILGNDLAGGKVSPVLEVVDKPDCFIPVGDISDNFPEVFAANVVTRAQKRRIGDDIVLADTFLSPVFTEEHFGSGPKESENVRHDRHSDTAIAESELLAEPISHEGIKTAQREDVSLTKCFSAAESPQPNKVNAAEYVIENGLMLRKWHPHRDGENEWDVVCQIVLPTVYRKQVLSLAHDHDLAGHLGVTKTYNRILKHFFWPGLKSDVSKYCRTCHECQVMGKPNQKIPPAPLIPIPVICEPFEHIILDCVGPLPKSKAGNQFLLTIMCSATRFPEAVPLRRITAPVIIKALIKFFSTFGLPKIVQTDQGTNFLSNVFRQVLKTLGISHRISSPYHPESQGAIERFHQTLKSMLKKYCLSSGKEWDDGVPLVLFAVREATQESLGFSPADLVFGHTVRGPLKVLKDGMLNDTKSSQQNVLDYVSRFRERLHNACSFARKSLSTAQEGMKKWYDRKAVVREIQPGDEVLVLLPVPGSVLTARFSGPYKVSKRLSETDFVIHTPDRKRKFRTCHINMLKLYCSRKVSEKSVEEKKKLVAVPTDVLAAAVVAVSDPTIVKDEVLRFSLGECDPDDGVTLRNDLSMCGRLSNSEILKKLSENLENLLESQKRDVMRLIQEFPMLFSDVPTQTHVLQHDIQVTCNSPIKQHAYRVNSLKRSVMRTEVDYLLRNDLAEPSYSPWSSPCLLVPKSDGTFRFCTDYRKVNSVTVPDSYPLPRMEDCIDNLGSARFVTKLDLLKGYWQVPLTARAADISAFVTPDNFLQYRVMAFGLRNAPATFQRLVNIVLSGVRNCNAYLDDLVIYSFDWSEHLTVLRTVFERLADASLTINLAKCEFGKATITYLGKEVGQGQVRPVSAKISAIADFPIPTTRRELRRFLGMAGYYRSFCRNFSTVVHPLTSLLSPANAFIWTDACQQAFEGAKLLLTSAPVLAAPDCTRCFKLEVDASALGMGAVLIQEDDVGFEHPICYFSRKFNRHQRNYSTIEKEALGLILALQFFEVYVGSSVLPVTVYTDHNPLVFLSRMYNHNQRLMRWSLIVQNYNLIIKHKKGSENIIADTLSRA